MRSEPLFFLLAFAFSWAIWIPIAATDAERSGIGSIAVGFAAAGPGLAGALCTAREEGWKGVRRLFGSLLHWRTDARWYALALGGPIAVALLAVGLHRLLFGDEARFGLEASTILLVPVAFIAGLFIGSLQEEPGWRGYALPRLLDRWGGVRAGSLLGVAWACWHLPLYAIHSGGQERTPLGVFLISVVALSILYTWFWVVTRGSLLIAVFLHSATNVAGVVLLKDARSDFGPVIAATALTVALAAVAGRHLERARPSPGQELQR
ncbi:MAG: CPBP family intramembrane metalloprotease [Actinomycetota bacterium]|nr:CPBP family intramembrane metalloprotease [Actinomycetota bacterium]